MAVCSMTPSTLNSGLARAAGRLRGAARPSRRPAAGCEKGARSHLCTHAPSTQQPSLTAPFCEKGARRRLWALGPPEQGERARVGKGGRRS
jgi:hypothetical protein